MNVALQIAILVEQQVLAELIESHHWLFLSLLYNNYCVDRMLKIVLTETKI